MVTYDNIAKLPANARAQISAAHDRLPIPVLLYLLCVVLPIGFQLGPIFMSTLRLFLIVMIIPLMIRLLSGQYGKIIITDILFILHVLWMGVALFANTPDQMIQQIGSVGVEFLGGYVIGRAYIRSRATFISMCRALIIIVLCTIPFALAETQTSRPPIIEFLNKIPGLSHVTNVNYPTRMGLHRVQASFVHPIHYGLFCSVVFSLSLVALKGVISDSKRFLYSFLVVATGFLALSSGALTAFALQFGFLIWAAMFKSYKQRWWFLVGLFVLGYVVIDLLSNRSPLDVFMSYATFSPHNAYMRAIQFDWGIANVLGSAEKGLAGSPIFGINVSHWVRPSFIISSSVDNFWLLIVMRYGVPGFLFLALGYGIGIARVMRRNFEGDERLTLIRRAWVFTFMGLTFTLSTVHVWTNIYSFVFFMFGTGIWLITAVPGGDEGKTASAEPPKDPARGIRYSRFPQKPAASQT